MKGTYYHSIDAKGRLFIPAKLREEMGESFVITRGLDNCLAIYPQSEWEKLEQSICAMPLSRARDLQRFFFAAAFDATVDAQGRVVLPANLREYAGLCKEAVVIGTTNRAEIWDATRWADYNDNISQQRILEAMEEVGF